MHLLKIKIRNFYKKGLSQVALKLIKEREEARKSYKQANGVDKERLHTIYRIARNKVIAKIRKDERMATINFIKESGKPSDYWKVAKQITEPNSNQKWS